MVNRKILIAVTLFAPYVVSAQEQVTEVESADAGSMVIIYVILAVLALGIAAVYILLSKKCEKLTSKQHVLKSKIDDLSAPMWDGNSEKLEKRIKQLEDRLKQLEEKEVPQEIKVDEEKKEEVKEEEDEPVFMPETPKEEIYYANYRPHDEFFNLSNTENDGWLIWKITKLSANEASYELADIEPSKYADQWFKISNIVKCDTPPSGNITSARTIKSGRLVNNDGYWRVNPEHIVEIEFKCE